MSKKKRSVAEDLVDLVALLPWWVGVVLAALSYVVLHSVAPSAVAPAVQTGQISTMVVGTFLQTLAVVGQYLIPLICLVGAGLSAWKRHERKGLVQSVVQSKSADALDGMTWTQFEVLVGEAFRLQGYSVTETGGGADGGVDLILTRGGEKLLVQCKQWKAFKVGVDVVRELYGVMAAKGAAGGFVVTSGRFTAEASAFASGRNVKLIDGPKLFDLIKQTQSAAHSAPVRAPTPSPGPVTSVKDAVAPACPRCSKQMVKRLARKGANAGGEFWGCTGYPACKGAKAAE